MQNYTEVYKSWCSIVSALSMLAPRFLCLRKRRRQHYHRNKVNRPVNPNVKEKKMYNKKTMDNGQFEAPLIEMRRKITIKQKMEVLTYFEEILKRKREANKQYHEPRPVGASKEALAAWHEKIKKASKERRLAPSKMCKQKFPNIVQGARVSRWYKTAKKEGWSDLPEVMRARCTDTPNCWRSRVGAPLKGRAIGGSVPVPLQVELDMLMVEMSSGLSSVSERKEIVSSEHVASWHYVGAS